MHITEKKRKKLATMNNNLYICKVMKKIVFALMILLLLGGCKHRNMKKDLDAIDSLVVVEFYDSAYSIISGIEESAVSDQEDRARYNLLMTQLGYLTGNPLPSDSMLDVAITYFKEKKDQARLADCYYYKSNREVLNGDFPKAVRYVKEAEHLATGIRQQYKIAERLTFLNELCGNYTLQLDYARQSLEYAKKADNKNWMVYSYSSIGAAFSNLDKFDSAHFYFTLTTPYVIYIKDEGKKAGFLTNIGMLYKDEDMEKAKGYFRESLKHKESSAALENLADILFKEGKREEAYKLWKKALTINDGDYKDNIIHSILSYDIERGHIENVCDNLDEIIYIKDSMLNKLKNDTIKDLQLRFDHEVAMHKQEKITSNWKIGALIIAVLLLMLVVYIIRKRSKMKEQMHEVQMQINDYVAQINELKATNEDVTEAVDDLNNKINMLLEAEAPLLLRGKMLYDQIENGKIEDIYLWSKNDEKLFVEFYKTIKYRRVHEIMRKKRVAPLTQHRLFYLLLKDMGKNDYQIKDIFKFTDNSMKMLRARTKEID